MQSDWSVACGADDSLVVVPWASEDESIRYIDLQDAPARVSEIPEATQYASLAAALQRWNQRDAPLFTAKCDVWNYTADHFDAEDLAGFAFAQASYIDLLPRDPMIFSSFTGCEQMLRTWTERSHSIALPEGRCEWILRPARVLSVPGDTSHSVSNGADHSGYDGFATTLYVWGYGSSPQTAADVWSTALLALIEPVLLIEKFKR